MNNAMKENFGNRVLKGVFIIVIIRIAAKVASFVSEAVLAAYLGLNYESDAYYMVWGLEDVVYPMVSVGIWNVFLPLYKSYIARDERALAYGLMNKAQCFFSVISLAVAGLVFAFAPAVVSVIAPGFDETTRQLCIKLVRISAPMYVFITASTVYASALQCHEQFLGSQIREVASHIPIIIAAVFFYKRFGIEAMAVALVVAGMLRLLIEIPFVNWGYKFKPDFGFKNQEFLLMLKRLPSALLSAGIARVNTLVDKAMASTLPTGTVSSLNYGSKLMHVFSGLISSAISTATYPQMINFISLNKKKELSRLVVKIVNIFCVLMVPITCACVLFRTEMVAAVFERGAFDANSTLLTADVFALYCLSLFFVASSNVIGNVFYGYGDTKTPMYISVMNFGLNVALNFILLYLLGVNGLALATSLSAMIAFFVRLILVRKHVKLKMRLMLTTGVKVLIASVVACIIPRAIFWICPANKYVTLLVSALIGAGLYFVMIKQMKVDEIDDIIGILKRKIKKA